MPGRFQWKRRKKWKGLNIFGGGLGGEEGRRVPEKSAKRWGEKLVSHLKPPKNGSKHSLSTADSPGYRLNQIHNPWILCLLSPDTGTTETSRLNCFHTFDQGTATSPPAKRERKSLRCFKATPLQTVAYSLRTSLASWRLSQKSRFLLLIVMVTLLHRYCPRIHRYSLGLI